MNLTKMNQPDQKKIADVPRIRAGLKAYLSLNRMTQKEYAKKIKVSRSFLSRVIWDKGASMRILERIQKDILNHRG